jgi:nucleoside-diphosphate-sugar epimerase
MILVTGGAGFIGTNFALVWLEDPKAEGIIKDKKVADMLDTIWLDWRKQQLTQPIWKPIGVDQAVASILNHVQRDTVN